MPTVVAMSHKNITSNANTDKQQTNEHIQADRFSNSRGENIMKTNKRL